MLARLLFSLGIRRNTGASRCASWSARQALAVTALIGCAATAGAQTPQYVYTSNATPPATLSGFIKNGSTGVLSITPGSPYNERFDPQQLAVDPGGKYLYVLNTSQSSVSMFQIDSATGALTEVPRSPFSGGGGTQPQAIAVSPSGTYVFVGNHTGALVASKGSIDTYQVDTVGQTLTPVASVQTASPVIALVTDPKGRNLYAYMGPNAVNGDTIPYLPVYSIDANTGKLTEVALNTSGANGRSLAMDPQGRFLFAGYGQLDGFVNSLQISAVDGTFLGTPLTTSLGTGALPLTMAVDGTGKFLYVALLRDTRIFSVDSTTGALTETSASPVQPSLSATAIAADPQGPYLYTLSGGALRGFQVNSTNGALTEITGSPFGSPGSITGLAITSTAVQPVSGPVASLQPAALPFGSWNIGTTSNTLVTQLVDTGSQVMFITSISITGTNATDFNETNTCGASLAVNANCSISVTFTPTAAGVRTASLSVADNAAGSPQSVSLTGTGVTPLPGVTLAPGSLTFSDLAIGQTSAAQTVTVTNSGSATLHISSVSLTGSNAGDFAQTNTCGAVAVNASCAISVTFTPSAAGARVATISITDDASGSPQSVSLTGTGDQPFTVQAGSSGTTSATVTAGQTAQFNLQATPAPGFSGSISLSCSGAPAAATCQVSPVTLLANGTTPLPFSVSVSTTARSASLPPYRMPSPLPPGGLCTPLFVLAILALFWMAGARTVNGAASVLAQRLARFRRIAVLLLLTSAGAAGCGGGGGDARITTPPPQQGTPPGTSTLTVTATSGNVSQQIQLTLTVK